MSDGTPRPVLHGIASILLAFADAIWTPDMPPIPAVRPGGGDCWWRTIGSGVWVAQHRCALSRKITSQMRLHQRATQGLLAPPATVAFNGRWQARRSLSGDGSNIGSCTLEFLLYTDAVIIAVEPNPFTCTT